jgi:hypothetical protein
MSGGSEIASRLALERHTRVSHMLLRMMFTVVVGLLSLGMVLGLLRSPLKLYH